MSDHRDERGHPGPEVMERIARDGPSSAEERRHLDACASCRHELDWLRGFQAAVAHVPERRPSRGFTDRVMDHVTLPRQRKSPAEAPGWLGWPGWIGAGVAAMVAVTAALGWTWIATRPDVSLQVLAGLALETAHGVLVSVAMEVGGFLVASGIAPALSTLFGELSTTSALGALGVLAVLGLATGVAALQALRPPAAWHTLNT
jgi:hypothetical protein